MNYQIVHDKIMIYQHLWFPFHGKYITKAVLKQIFKALFSEKKSKLVIGCHRQKSVDAQNSIVRLFL
jgi:hypothetical protein